MSERTIKELVARPYQQAIIDQCIKQNTIVFLPTGSGKSYIAIQVMKHFSQQLEKKYSEGGKRSVFLVTTVCLAKQQAETIQEMVPYNVCILTGEQDVDYWKEDKWSSVLDENEILVATAQVILDAVNHSFLSLDQVNVIVFDECHHGRLSHPYKEIMKLFKYVKAEETRIIGLSGMLIGNDSSIKPSVVKEELELLEATYQATIATVNNIDHHQNVLIHSTKAVESFVRYMRDATHPCVTKIARMLEGHTQKLKTIKIGKKVSVNPKTLRAATQNKIKDLISLLDDFVTQSNELGAYGGYLSLLSSLVQLEIKKRTGDSHMYLETVKSCITIVERCVSVMENQLALDKTDPSAILSNSSQKFRHLVTVLKTAFNDPNREKDLQCIIFVKQRSTAKVLYHALKELAKFDTLFPITPDFIVGVNNALPEPIESILSSTYNSMTIEKFKNKETNCIVATSVLEEGIDLQMCNLIVMFEPPTTYRSYVQARGRARCDNSKYIVLLNNDDIDKFQKKIRNYHSVDATLKDQLVMKTIDREPPSPESIRKGQEDVWEPFITPSQSVLSNLNCISLLSCYAQQMPSDRFTESDVVWRRIDNEDGTVQVALQLPSQSVLKDEIIGDKQINIKLAKQHAAFKACIELYERGEISDNLVPCKDDQKLELHTDEYFEHWSHYGSDKKGEAGNRNNRRYHKLKTPTVLIDSAPRIGAVNFIYRIVVTPKFETQDNYGVEVFKELLNNRKSFGILTSKRIPKLCKMSFFPTYGEVEVEIEAIPAGLTMKNESELNLLRNFHVAIFRDVLKTWENYFVLDRSSFLIVPLTEDVSIDWSLVKEFQEVKQPKLLTYDEKNQTEFTHDEYYRRVINPVYRETSANYVVLDVREDMSPLSPFPSEEYSHFKEYIELKFGQQVLHTTQPMIEVKGISTNLNVFFPGQGASGGRQRKERELLNEYLIPEICHNYKFPADFWLKAMLLPSVCHRMRYLLFAEELRDWLFDENVDQGVDMDQTYKLDVDYGSYDSRKLVLNQENAENEIHGKYPNKAKLLEQLKIYLEAQQATGDSPHTRALLLWDKNKLPIDIERHLMTLTEVDLDFYLSFLQMEKNKISPESISRLQQLNGASPKRDRYLMDIDDRSEIQILKLDDDCKRVEQKDLIKVLTTSKAGDVFDMERYEVLGDAYLKFIASLFLYKRHEEYHEGYLTTLKGQIVGNRNLFYIGDQFGLSGMIKSSSFNAHETLAQSTRVPESLHRFLEENKTLLTKLYNVEQFKQEEIISGVIDPSVIASLTTPRGEFPIEQDPNDLDDRVEKSLLTFINQHYVGDKIIADAVEALIGVVVQSSGIAAGLRLCCKLKILPQSDLTKNLLSERIAPRVASQEKAETFGAKLHNRAELEKIIGYKFNDVTYLTQAMTHASYHIKALGSYEQLEFLGDAVLDFLITSYITEQCPLMDPGKLTDLRSALVNNVTLACVVVRNSIHKYLLSESVLLSEAIKKFVVYQSSNEHQVVLDQVIMLDTEDDTTMAESVDVPKAVGDIFESIIGAVFLDSGLNLNTTWQVIYGLLKNEIDLFIADVPMQIVRQLFEYEKGKAEPKFYDREDLDDGLIGIPLEFKFKSEKKVVLGIGRNRDVAKKCAAKLALKALKEH